MSKALINLIAKFPPPTKLEIAPNWTNLEDALGVQYPSTFKDFIDTYGGCVWFDKLSPFIRQGRTKKEAREFPAVVVEMCDIDRGNTWGVIDGKFQQISPPFYPEPGGLLPFLVDYSGSMYFWDTESDEPEQWPVIQSEGGSMTRHPAMSIPEMILKWLDRDPVMIQMWGDVEQISQERLRITEVK